MRIFYRSASHIRRPTSNFSRIRDLANRALVLVVYVSEATGIGQFLRSLCTWLAFVVLLPAIGLLYMIKLVYLKAVQKLIEKLYPEENLELVLNSSFRTCVDTYNSYGIVTLLLLADGAPSIKNIQNQVAKQVEDLSKQEGRENAKRIKKRLGVRLGCYVWEDSEKFKIENQVFLASDKWRGKSITENVLQDYLNDIALYQLPSKYPPWQIIIVPYKKLDSWSKSYAVIVRVHHLLADTVTLRDLFLCPSNDLFPVVQRRSTFPYRFPQESITTVTWKGLTWRRIFNIIHFSFLAPSIVLSELLSFPSFAKRRFRSHVSSTKKTISWSEDIPLTFLQRIKSKAGATTNEVLLSCIAGALKQYFQMREGDAPVEDFPAVLPVYDSPAVSLQEEKPSGLLTVMLPISPTDPLSRLTKIQRRMTRLRQNLYKFELSKLLLQLVPKLIPPLILKLAAHIVTKKYPVIISNTFVSPCFGTVWGSDVSMIHYWRPPMANTGLSLSVMHYADRVALAVMANSSALQRPDILASCFVKEINTIAVALDVRRDRRLSPSPSSVIQSY
ncbi:uncharacterized protein LOC106464896 [Limulus polyphemus]|uniref:Uncharacterized protein LOC106464896 n=1 Tax=Limulus polyphemus TaxID=6850 RepID=A0ABM1SXQ3_LIMPO|nr:uncharacterized protein LOC106464896 [Limulus polyphemus]